MTESMYHVKSLIKMFIQNSNVQYVARIRLTIMFAVAITFYSFRNSSRSFITSPETSTLTS